MGVNQSDGDNRKQKGGEFWRNRGVGTGSGWECLEVIVVELLINRD